MSFVESPKPDATDGELIELRRQASAAEVSVTQKIAAIEMEAAVEMGAAEEARHKEAGKEQDSKFARGTVEGDIVVEGAGQVAPAAGIAVNLWDGMKEAKSNPSQDAGTAEARAKGLVSAGSKSFEDNFKAMKQAPIQTPLGRSFAEKTGTGSLKSLAEEVKGIKDNGAGAAQLKSGGMLALIKNEYSHHAANEKVLGQVIAAEKIGPVPSAMGMGPGQVRGASRGMTLENNKFAQGPSGPNFSDEEALA